MLLSIIVPIYNAEKYLDKCIKSILNQTFRDFELILVNDGSTDDSKEICDRYASSDKRVKVLHSEHGGVIHARKSGVAVAHGQYITFVDADDWIENDMYEIMMTDAECKSADIVICEMVREISKGQVAMPNYVEKGFYDKKKLIETFYPEMLFNFKICAPSVMPSLCNKLIKKEIIEQVIFDVDDSIVFGEDALVSYPAMFIADKIFIEAKPLYHYRQNFQSVTNVYDEKLLGKILLLHDELKKQFVKLGFDEKDQLFGYVASYSITCARKELLKNPAPLRKRIAIVKSYVADERVATALKMTSAKFQNAKKRYKVNALMKKRFLTLYLLFAIKEKMLKLRGYRYEEQ